MYEVLYIDKLEDKFAGKFVDKFARKFVDKFAIQHNKCEKFAGRMYKTVHTFTRLQNVNINLYYTFTMKTLVSIILFCSINTPRKVILAMWIPFSQSKVCLSYLPSQLSIFCLSFFIWLHTWCVIFIYTFLPKKYFRVYKF